MSNLIPHVQFLSEPDGDIFFMPWVDMQPRTSPISDASDYTMSLPAELCGLENPTQEEKIAILRFLALRLARVMYMAEWPDGLRWYESYYEDTSISDYLEVATAVLAALCASVISTTDAGEITMEFAPIVEDMERFLVEDFVPLAHYMRVANPDDDEDFEYNFDDASYEVEELESIYCFDFFLDANRLVNLDAIINLGSDESTELTVAAVRSSGISTRQPQREYNQPLDRILLSIIGVVQFFKSTWEYGDISPESVVQDPTIEELRQDMLDYIEEFPDEEEVARETFEERSQGFTYDFSFIAEAAVLRDLGLTSVVEDEDGVICAVLSPPKRQLNYLNKLGVSPESDYFDDPFAAEEPIGLVRLGWSEYYFFTPDGADEE